MSYSTTAKLIFGVPISEEFADDDHSYETLDLFVDHLDVEAELVYDGDARCGGCAVFLSFKTIYKRDDGDPVTIPPDQLVINNVRSEIIRDQLAKLQNQFEASQTLTPTWHLLTYTS